MSEDSGPDICLVDTESIPLFSHPVSNSFEDAIDDMRLGLGAVYDIVFILENADEDGIGIDLPVLWKVTKSRECAALSERGELGVSSETRHSGLDSVLRVRGLRIQRKSDNCGPTKEIGDHRCTTSRRLRTPKLGQ